MAAPVRTPTELGLAEFGLLGSPAWQARVPRWIARFLFEPPDIIRRPVTRLDTRVPLDAHTTRRLSA